MSKGLERLTKDKDSFQRLTVAIKELFGAYPNANGTPENMIVYFKDLAELPIDCVEIALVRLRRKNRYIPAVAEIYEAVEAVREERAAEFRQSQAEREREQRNAPGEWWPEDIRAEFKAILGGVDMAGVNGKCGDN